jgi:hypothetical protein
LAEVHPVRLTVYVTPQQLGRLRLEAQRRQRQGARADVSMLIREAIEDRFPPRAPKGVRGDV